MKMKVLVSGLLAILLAVLCYYGFRASNDVEVVEAAGGNASAGESQDIAPAKAAVGGDADEAIGLITLAELVEGMEQGKVVVFDVRPGIFYQMKHIPESHLLRLKGFAADFKKHKPLLDEARSKSRGLVFYCAGVHCPDAGKVARLLQAEGYGRLFVFKEGLELWEQAGLPVESSY